MEELFEEEEEEEARDDDDTGAAAAAEIPVVSLAAMGQPTSDDEWASLERERDDLARENAQLKAAVRGVAEFAREARAMLAAVRRDVETHQIDTERTAAAAVAAARARDALVDDARRADAARAVAACALAAASCERWRASAEIERVRRREAVELARRETARVELAADARRASDVACTAALAELAASKSKLETLETSCDERSWLASAEAEKYLEALVQTKLDLAAKEYELLTTKHLASPRCLENVSAKSRRLASSFDAASHKYSDAKTPRSSSSTSSGATPSPPPSSSPWRKERAGANASRFYFSANSRDDSFDFADD